MIDRAFEEFQTSINISDDEWNSRFGKFMLPDNEPVVDDYKIGRYDCTNCRHHTECVTSPCHDNPLCRKCFGNLHAETYDNLYTCSYNCKTQLRLPDSFKPFSSDGYPLTSFLINRTKCSICEYVGNNVVTPCHTSWALCEGCFSSVYDTSGEITHNKEYTCRHCSKKLRLPLSFKPVEEQAFLYTEPEGIDRYLPHELDSDLEVQPSAPSYSQVNANNPHGVTKDRWIGPVIDDSPSQEITPSALSYLQIRYSVPTARQIQDALVTSPPFQTTSYHLGVNQTQVGYIMPTIGQSNSASSSSSQELRPNRTNTIQQKSPTEKLIDKLTPNLPNDEEAKEGRQRMQDMLR